MRGSQLSAFKAERWVSLGDRSPGWGAEKHRVTAGPRGRRGPLPLVSLTQTVQRALSPCPWPGHRCLESLGKWPPACAAALPTADQGELCSHSERQPADGFLPELTEARSRDPGGHLPSSVTEALSSSGGTRLRALGKRSTQSRGRCRRGGGRAGPSTGIAQRLTGG